MKFRLLKMYNKNLNAASWDRVTICGKEVRESPDKTDPISEMTTILEWEVLSKSTIHPFIHPSIFSKHFIPVRMAVDPESIWAKLSAISQNITAIYSGNLELPINLLACFWEVGKPRELWGDPHRHGEIMWNWTQTDLSAGLNQGAWRCEAATLLTVLTAPPYGTCNTSKMGQELSLELET